MELARRWLAAFPNSLANASRGVRMESNAFRAGFEAGHRAAIERKADNGAHPDTINAEAGQEVHLDMTDAAMSAAIDEIIARVDEMLPVLHQRLDEIQARLRRPLAL